MLGIESFVEYFLWNLGIMSAHRLNQNYRLSNKCINFWIVKIKWGILYVDLINNLSRI